MKSAAVSLFKTYLFLFVFSYVVESMGAVQVKLMSSSSTTPVDRDVDASNQSVPIKTQVKMPI